MPLDRPLTDMANSWSDPLEVYDTFKATAAKDPTATAKQMRITRIK